MIRTITSTGLVLAIIGIAQAQDGGFLADNQERILAVNTTTTATSTTNTTTVKTATSQAYKGLKFYGDSPKIAHTTTLGCGACIRGGYSYCIPNKVPGSDPATWLTGKKAVCCKDDACVTTTLKDTTVSWTCSKSNYTDPVLALGMCPFTKSRCGSANSTLNFTGSLVGQTQTLNISLALGETCTYRVQSNCGLPEFTPLANTTGFDIQVVDFDDDDVNVNSPAPLPLTSLQQTNASSLLAVAKKSFDSKTFKVRRATANIKNATKGLIAKSYNPNEGVEYKFKSGKKANSSE
jgi:hypothetical protein